MSGPGSSALQPLDKRDEWFLVQWKSMNTFFFFSAVRIHSEMIGAPRMDDDTARRLCRWILYVSARFMYPRGCVLSIYFTGTHSISSLKNKTRHRLVQINFVL
jgi:hypothetical protein